MEVYTIEPYYEMILTWDGGVTIKSYHPQSKGRALSQWLCPHGYLKVKLGGRDWYVHQLVALYTLGERPKGLVTNHIDGVKTNNTPSNLEYCTIAENIQHAVRTGLHVCNDPKRNGMYIDGRSKDKNASGRLYYANNKLKEKIRKAKYYQENKASILERQRAKRTGAKI